MSTSCELSYIVANTDHFGGTRDSCTAKTTDVKIKPKHMVQNN